jgi:sugar O-acyltransferase (sialic acid O-acetyltransferase NeuD family)
MFAPEVADLANDTGRFEVAAFIENLEIVKTRQPWRGLPVIWIDDAAPLAATHQAVCSIGSTRRQPFIERVEQMGFRFARIVHPRARISASSVIGDGVVISAGVMIAAETTIGRHVIINRGATIGHNTLIQDYVTVGPGANIAGGVTIDRGAYVGIGATVVDRIRIGAHAFVSAGAVVMKDVPDQVQVLGNPARIVKERLDGH